MTGGRGDRVEGSANAGYAANSGYAADAKEPAAVAGPVGPGVGSAVKP